MVPYYLYLKKIFIIPTIKFLTVLHYYNHLNRSFFSSNADFVLTPAAKQQRNDVEHILFRLCAKYEIIEHLVCSNITDKDIDTGKYKYSIGPNYFKCHCLLSLSSAYRSARSKKVISELWVSINRWGNFGERY